MAYVLYGMCVEHLSIVHCVYVYALCVSVQLCRSGQQGGKDWTDCRLILLALLGTPPTQDDSSETPCTEPRACGIQSGICTWPGVLEGPGKPCELGFRDNEMTLAGSMPLSLGLAQ